MGGDAGRGGELQRIGVFKRARHRRALIMGLAIIAAGGLLQARVAPSPAVAQSPPTTLNPIEELLKGILTPPTVPPPPPVAPPAGESAPDGSAPAAADAVPPPVGDPTTPQSISPDLQALIDSVQRTGGRTTLPLMDELLRLKDVGFTEDEAALIGMGHFPVGGEATYRDDFLEFRAGPPVHGHQGTDIFANRGTPVRAPFDGTVSFSEGGLAGKMFYLNASDGNTYFGCHLDTFADIGSGSHVEQGQIVGTVGDTGNAVGGSPHLHFEVHQGGGAAVNPKPILDGWIDEAIAHIPEILAPYFETGSAGIPRALTDAGLLRRYDRPTSAGSPQITVLWASSVSPETGTLNLAKLQAAQASGQVNWEQVAALQQAIDDAWNQARDLARAVLLPVTPQPVAPILIGAAPS